MTTDESLYVPEGWTRSSVGAVARLIKERVDPKTMPADSPYVGLEHVEAHTMRLLGHGNASDVKSAKTRFRAGDVLYGKLRPYLNKVARPNFDGICSTDFLAFGESPSLNQSYLANYLNQLWVAERAHHVSTGVELPRIDWKGLSQFPIAYPSKDVQRDIASQIEHLATLRVSAASHIASAQRAIERFRRSVHAAACSGRLTADLRDSGVDATEPPPGSPINIPSTWRWAPIESLLRDKRALSYGILKPGKLDPDGVPMVRIMDIKDGGIDVDQVVRVSPSVASEYSRTQLEAGDIILAVMATVGRSAIVPLELTGANVNRALAVLKLSERIDPRYMNIAIQSPFFQNVFASAKLGSAQARINLRDLRSFLVPLPPLDEQHRLAERVDRLMALSNDIGIKILAARRMVETTAQSVLAKAFRGELTTEAMAAEIEDAES